MYMRAIAGVASTFPDAGLAMAGTTAGLALDQVSELLLLHSSIGNLGWAVTYRGEETFFNTFFTQGGAGRPLLPMYCPE